jgi:hypothetical protein
VTRLILAASAVLLLAAFGIAQASSYARRPLVAEVAPYGAEIAREISCGSLRQRFSLELNVWKGGVKDGHRAQVQPHLEAMVATLERLAVLEERGRCGG